jgi:uncharacterized membrane protein
MNKTWKVLLGLLTLWPLCYLVLFFILTFIGIFFGAASQAPFIQLILPVHLLTMLLIFGLVVFYIVNVFKNKRIESDKKALWAVVLFMGGMIAMPVYWYLFIWKDEAAPGAHAQLGSVDTSAWANKVNTGQRKQEQYVPPSQPPDWR